MAGGSEDGARGSRDAEAGELCTCGRPAVTVALGGRYGDTGECGQDDRIVRPDGVCGFCGDSVDHVHYAATERAAGRPRTAEPDPRIRQSGRCPLYRLRLADPLPALHDTSVRRFDPTAWRREQVRRRLIAEIAEVMLATGIEGDPDDAGIAGEITVDQLGEVLADDTADGTAAPAFLLASLLADLRHSGVDDTGVRDLTLDRIAAGAPDWERAEPLQRARLVLTRVRGELDAAGLLYAVPEVTDDLG